MSDDVKPEPKKSDALDEATLDQVSGGAAREQALRENKTRPEIFKG